MNVDRAQIDLELKVWKDLAINKQILIRAATDALKLDPNCTHEELKQALEDVLRRIAKADADVVAAQQQAKTSITAMESRLNAALKAQAAAEAAGAEIKAAQEKAARDMAVERATMAKELQKVKDRLAEEQKAIKAINTALADTPANVIKKLNTFKKEKQTEADARREVEAALAALRAEKKQQDKQLATLIKHVDGLADRYRELHTVGVTFNERLKASVNDQDSAELPRLPELDAKLLEDIEKTKTGEEEKPVVSGRFTQQPKVANGRR